MVEAESEFPSITTSVTGRVFALLPTTVIEAVPDPNATPADGEAAEDGETPPGEAEAGEAADGEAAEEAEVQ